MLELTQLEQLIAIDEQGTISKAAMQLHLSQPALSRSMQRLEQELQVALFERHKNHVELTECGKLTVAWGKKILEDVQRSTEQIRLFYQKQQMILVGSCAPAPQIRIAAMLTECYPERTVATEMRDLDKLEQGLLDGVYHMILLPYPLDAPGIFSFPYCEEHLALTVPQDHELASHTSGLYLRELDGITMLRYSKIGFWAQLCQREMPNAKFIVQNERDTFRELINASNLPAFSGAMTDRTVEEGRVTLPLLDEDANPTFWCSLLEKNRGALKCFLQAQKSASDCES